MTLFQRGNFVLASGREARWKIECNALTADDWSGLAEMACERFGLPGDVVGVPRGGLPFAEALKPYRCWSLGPLWIVDDVVTTGGSLERHLGQPRRPCPASVAARTAPWGGRLLSGHSPLLGEVHPHDELSTVGGAVHLDQGRPE